MPSMDLILPPLRRTVHDARLFALRVHSGQCDKAGEPYAGHLERVAQGADALVTRNEIRDNEFRDLVGQVAWLHDTVEDTRYDLQHLRYEGFRREVIDAVADLTRPSKTLYTDWIREIAEDGSHVSLIVKYADVSDNSNRRRLAALPEEVRERLTTKYGPAKKILWQALLDRRVIRTGGSEGSAAITDWAQEGRASDPDLPSVRPDDICTVSRRRAGLAAPKSGCRVPGCQSGGMLGCPYEVGAPKDD